VQRVLWQTITELIDRGSAERKFFEHELMLMSRADRA
jgi:hypothetical protein